MPELRFFIEGLEAVEHALAPTLRMKLRAVNGSPEPLRAVWLRCQLQIEPARRRYDAAEIEKLRGLFCAPERWDETLRPFLWQQTAVMLQGFTGTAVSDVLLPCSQDVTLAIAQFCEALSGGVIPILAQFSGIALLQRPEGIQAAPIPWDLEARYMLPVEHWQAAVRSLFGDGRWLRLERSAFERLLAFRTAHGNATWEQTLDTLLEHHLAAAWRSPERQRADPAGNRSPHSERPTGATRAKSGEPLTSEVV